MSDETYTPQNHLSIRKWGLYFAGAIGLVLFLLCALCLWWLLNPTLIFTADSPATDAETYHPGGPVYLQYEEFCTSEQKPIQVQRVAVQEETGRRLHFLLYTFDAKDVTLGCIEDLSVEYPLPEDMMTGPWHLETEITYQANPVRTVTQSFVSNSFTVLQK